MICASVVADFKSKNFQIITKICSRIQTLNKVQNMPLSIFLAIVFMIYFSFFHYIIEYSYL